MVPSSCHGVVFAAGNGKCQEMLSFRIVVLPAASACEAPPSSTSRSMSLRMLSGVTRVTATLAFNFVETCGHDLRARVLLRDREQTRIEEADLEEDEERQRAVDAIGERVEDRRREIEAERELHERLHGDRLAVLLPHPLVAVIFDVV